MNVYEKLMQVQSKLKSPKNQYNSFGKYHYRNCEDILESLKPLLLEVKAIVNITDEIVLIGDRYYVKSIVIFTDVEKGDNIQVNALAREEENKKGMDGSQITGSASSYARKYALNGLFAIDDTKDSDTTNEHSKEATQSKNNTPNDSKIICELCKKEVPQNVANFSKNKYKKILCMDCQKKQK